MDYYYPHEDAPFVYTVEVRPAPPADESKVECHKQTPDGAVFHSDASLKTDGRGKFILKLLDHNLTVADSPVWAVFHFKKNGAPEVRPIGLGISIADPQVRSIGVLLPDGKVAPAPAEVKPDEQIPLGVTAWTALAHDAAGAPPTAFEESKPDRIQAATKQGVKWKVAGNEIGPRGESVNAPAVGDTQAGKEIEVIAYVGEQQPQNPARATIKVPKLKIVNDPDGQPAKQSVVAGGNAGFLAIIEPEVDGTYAWEATAGGDKVRLQNANQRSMRLDANTEAEGDVTLKCTLTSRATRKTYEAQHSLKVTKYGVTSLSVSKPRLAPGPVWASGAAPGSAPRDDRVDVEYEINDESKAATKVKLELFRTVDGRLENVPVWTRELAEDERKHGKHKNLKWGDRVQGWGGEVPGHAAGPAGFPDNFITLEFSPYKLKIVMEGPGRPSPESQTCDVKVEFEKLGKLELGPETLLTGSTNEALERALLARIQADGGVPAPGGKREVFLESDLYVTDYNTMHNEAFAGQYQAMWGVAGPKIPLQAEVLLKDSNGQPVMAPLGLGNTRIVWDYEEPATKLDLITNAKAKAFVQAARDAQKAGMLPANGTNMQVARGGKHSVGGAPPVFFEPIGVSMTHAAATRRWASFLSVAKVGPLAGRAVAYFSPSRIAGDSYKLGVYVDVNKQMDVDTLLSAPDTHKQLTGNWIVWREIKIAKYWALKDARNPDIKLGEGATEVGGMFKPAHVKLKLATAGSIPFPNYDDHVRAAVNAIRARENVLPMSVDLAADHENAAMITTDARFTGYKGAVVFRDFAGFVSAFQSAFARYAHGSPVAGVLFEQYRGPQAANTLDQLAAANKTPNDSYLVNRAGTLNSPPRPGFFGRIAQALGFGGASSGGAASTATPPPSGGTGTPAPSPGPPPAPPPPSPINVAVGDIVRWDGTKWGIVVPNAGGFPPAGTRGKDAAGTVFEWDGLSLTPWFSSPEADFNARHWIATNLTYSEDEADPTDPTGTTTRPVQKKVSAEGNYLAKVNGDYARAIVREICEQYLEGESPGPGQPSPPGGYIYQFDFISNRKYQTFTGPDGRADWAPGTMGAAAPALRAASTGTCFNVYFTGPKLTTWPDGIEEVYAHEVGHAMFLAHSRDDRTKNYTDVANKVADPNYHDPADQVHCTMSYTHGNPHFCGGCILRLGGWRRP